MNTGDLLKKREPPVFLLDHQHSLKEQRGLKEKSSGGRKDSLGVLRRGVSGIRESQFGACHSAPLITRGRGGVVYLAHAPAQIFQNHPGCS